MNLYLSLGIGKLEGYDAVRWRLSPGHLHAACREAGREREHVRVSTLEGRRSGRFDGLRAWQVVRPAAATCRAKGALVEARLYVHEFGGGLNIFRTKKRKQ